MFVDDKEDSKSLSNAGDGVLTKTMIDEGKNWNRKQKKKRKKRRRKQVIK